MNQIGRRIYYDKSTGNVILDTGERQGDVMETTVDEDFESYHALVKRVRDTVGEIKLEYGQFAQDFAECNGYRINVETGLLEFSYPDPNETQPQEPVYQKPLSEQVTQLKAELKNTQEAVDFLLINSMPTI